MEVAGQWRREWAGTAEFGKVTSGGVTRQVARAMEVLQASGPGSRMRVMRAAYHSTSQQGAPLESFMMHSSRRVISSGSSLLQSPTFMGHVKPLEISSTPLETTPDRFSESENYKVTEPDDTDISEPSKWRSTNGDSARMPSEESSSTDNASVIDLDSRNKHTNLLRKSSYDSDSSDIQSRQSYKSRASTRASPLPDAPATLSTLKYKSLLNGISDSWTDRRKSYSFEDTSPLTDTIMHKNDTLAMESSTDSGICKSTEIMNENTDERTQQMHNTKKETAYEREETFKDWLAKNRQYKEMPQRNNRQNYITEEPQEENISVRSSRKVSITLPMDEKFQYMENHTNGDVDRKVKRVEFCKTELHFAAESGKVNIIATDEKPPPSNDFRRRKSAFVPIKSTFDKPITLFGDRLNDFPQVNEFEINETCDISESDENTTSTRSILKNKIPKPKPYLLGENMTLGQDFGPTASQGFKEEFMIPTAVSLINRQLQPEATSYKLKEDTNNSTSTSMSGAIRNGSTFDLDEDNSNIKTKFQRLNINRNSFRGRKQIDEVIVENNTNSIKQKLQNLQTSPILQRNTKARKLRESELTYFGISSNQNTKTKENAKQTNKTKELILPLQNKTTDDLRSVKLIQRVSNSVCNSEAESDDTPEYQNLGVFTGIKTNFAPVPAPRTRTNERNNYLSDDTLQKSFKQKVHIIKPVIEQSYEVSATNQTELEPRRSRHRKQDVSPMTIQSRSISEPPKYRHSELMSVNVSKVNDHNERKQDVVSTTRPRNNNEFIEENSLKKQSRRKTKTSEPLEEEVPLYVNIDDDNLNKSRSLKKSEKSPIAINSTQSKSFSEKRGAASKAIPIRENGFECKTDSLNSKIHKHSVGKRRESYEKDDEISQKRESRQRASKRNEVSSSSVKPDTEVLPITEKNASDEKEPNHRTRSSQRHSTKESSKKTQEEKYDSYGKQSNEKKKQNAKHEQKSQSTRRERSASRDTFDVRAENVRASTNSQYKNSKKRYNGESESSADKHSRSDYVINYHDKDGTVSSICKINPGTSKRKIVHPEKIVDIKPKTKSADKKDKKSLLQYHDHWTHSGMKYDGTYRKKKVLMQRTCAIL